MNRAYIQVKDLDPSRVMELELSPLQIAEISHHINNPMTVVFWSISKLKENPGDKRALEMLENSARRIAGYVHKITHQRAAS